MTSVGEIREFELSVKLDEAEKAGYLRGLKEAARMCGECDGTGRVVGKQPCAACAETRDLIAMAPGE